MLNVLRAGGLYSVSCPHVFRLSGTTLETLPEFLPVFGGEIFTDLVDRITADSSHILRFCLKNGLDMTEYVERSVRWGQTGNCPSGMKCCEESSESKRWRRPIYSRYVVPSDIIARPDFSPPLLPTQSVDPSAPKILSSLSAPATAHLSGRIGLSVYPCPHSTASFPLAHPVCAVLP